MHTINRSLILPYSASEMYGLVDDIDQYYTFLPWCEHSAVLDRKEAQVTARIGISYKGLQTAFTTRNQLIVDQEVIMELVEGPFEHFSGLWFFQSLDVGVCKVSLDMQFSLSSRLANRTLTPIYKYITGTLVESFAKQAKYRYGERQFR
ncbi:MAG: ubiquinone-binding protein [Acidiferrobacteraceae bacterium]|nr:ubiquinone-binding protein [Acidiferrobacteraceae bacterium]